MAMNLQFTNLVEPLDHFRDEPSCLAYLEEQCWQGQPFCPHCDCQKVYRTNPGFKCANKDCRKKIQCLGKFHFRKLQDQPAANAFRQMIYSLAMTTFLYPCGRYRISNLPFYNQPPLLHLEKH